MVSGQKRKRAEPQENSKEHTKCGKNGPPDDEERSSDSDGFGGWLSRMSGTGRGLSSTAEQEGRACSASGASPHSISRHGSLVPGLAMRTASQGFEENDDSNEQLRGTKRGRVRSVIEDMLSPTQDLAATIEHMLSAPLEEPLLSGTLEQTIDDLGLTPPLSPAADALDPFDSAGELWNALLPAGDASPSQWADVEEHDQGTGEDQPQSEAKQACSGRGRGRVRRSGRRAVKRTQRKSVASPRRAPKRARARSPPLPAADLTPTKFSAVDDALFMSTYAPPPIRSGGSAPRAAARVVSESPLTADSQLSTGLHGAIPGFEGASPRAAWWQPEDGAAGQQIDWKQIDPDWKQADWKEPANVAEGGILDTQAALKQVLEQLTPKQRVRARRVLETAIRLQERDQARLSTLERMRELLVGQPAMAGISADELDVLIGLVMNGDRLRSGVRSLIRQQRLANQADGESNAEDAEEEAHPESEPVQALTAAPSALQEAGSNAASGTPAAVWRSPRKPKPKGGGDFVDPNSL